MLSVVGLDDAVPREHITEILVGERLHLLGGHHNVADKATATLIDTAALGLAFGVVSEDETIAENTGGVVVVLHILWGFDYITKIMKKSHCGWILARAGQPGVGYP